MSTRVTLRRRCDSCGGSGFQEFSIDLAELLAELRGNQPTQESGKTMMLEALPLSARAYNCILNAGIRSVEELANTSPEQMLKWKNCSTKTVLEIVLCLARAGLIKREIVR